VTEARAPVAEKAVRRLTMIALTMIILLVGVLGGLAATIRLQGAVIASGTLVVDSYVKPVQHQKGGTVGEILIKNGDSVRAGQILVHLDDTQTRANLAIVSKRLKELSARTARLSAERDALETISFPAELLGQRDIADYASMLEGEQRLFQDVDPHGPDARHSSQNGFGSYRRKLRGWRRSRRVSGRQSPSLPKNWRAYSRCLTRV
jgi:HlyD family secretion protein